MSHAKLAGSNGKNQATAAAAQWLPRLYRSHYTRFGRRHVLEGWAVKIQYQGRRHTFSLGVKTREAAAADARAIHDTILTQGWEAALGIHRQRRVAPPASKSEVRYWRQQLVTRPHHFPFAGDSGRDQAVWIEHAGVGYFFPLGTPDPEVAAVTARMIYQTVLKQGWNVACKKFPRELVVGFEWSANPILWSYTTLHTLVGKDAEAECNPAANRTLNRVLLVEEDPGIRRALTWCINRQTQFCGLPCGSAGLFAQAMESFRPQLVLLNRNLVERLGFPTPGQLAPIRPGVAALTFTVCADGDHLFVSTPGGAAGYVLRRVNPTRLLEPISGVVARSDFKTEDLLAGVRSFFKSLIQVGSPPDVSPLHHLTRREREVLGLLGKGCADKEIAQALGISAWTVHGHVKKIFERLQVRTRMEAVLRYLEK